jgi:hypothetical protein
VLAAGDFSYDLTSGGKGRVVMNNCRGDVAYSPLFNLTRGPLPKNASYEATVLSPAHGVRPTTRASLGTICGDRCTFILHDGTTRPLPREANRLNCGGSEALTNSTVTNHTTAELILNKNVRNCRIECVGPVVDRGEGNNVIRIARWPEPGTRNGGQATLSIRTDE